MRVLRQGLFLNRIFRYAAYAGLFLVCLTPLTAGAEDITWDGSGTLQTDPGVIPPFFPLPPSPATTLPSPAMCSEEMSKAA